MENTAILNLRVNADTMSTDAIHAKLQKGLDDMEQGRTTDAKQAFESFQRTL